MEEIKDYNDGWRARNEGRSYDPNRNADWRRGWIEADMHNEAVESVVWQTYRVEVGLAKGLAGGCLR